MEKDLDISSPEGLKAAVADLGIHGDPAFWICISKAWSHEKNWMHSTKVCLVRGQGLLIQTSTELGTQGEKASSQALAFVPGTYLEGRTYQGTTHYEIRSSSSGDYSPGSYYLDGVRKSGKEPTDVVSRA